MPDDFGRYTLAEMREMTRRCLDANRVPNGLQPQDIVQNPPIYAGDEIGPIVLDPLFSNQDLNFFINSAIMSVCIDMLMASETVLADEDLINIQADVPEYSLPDDTMLLKGLYWKPHTVAEMLLPPSRRIQMRMIDEPAGEYPDISNGAPTYRRQLNQIVLDPVPKHDNPGGILVRFSKPLLYLKDETATLETEFAWPMQEVVIRRAAKEAAGFRGMVLNPMVSEMLGQWEQRLTLLVMNSTSPSSVQMVTRVPRQLRSGRRLHVA